MLSNISLLAVPLCATLFAWCIAVSLEKKGRLRKPSVILRVLVKTFSWLTALALVRDHVIRLSLEQHNSMSTGSMILGSLLALFFAATVINAECITRRELVWKNRGALRDALAGLGFGAFVAFLAYTTEFLPHMRLTQSSSMTLAALAISWNLALEVVLRGVWGKAFKKLLPVHLLLLTSATLGCLSWMGLALSGPFPTEVILALGAWLSVTSTIAHHYFGFPGSTMAGAALLVALSLPH